MRRIVLVRHGESAWNAEGRVQGQSGPGLSELGHRQARATAEEIGRRHSDADLWVSDLQRAVETVEPMQDVLGCRAVVDERLRERSFGSWEGSLRDDVIARDGDRWQRWMSGQDVIPEVGGETADQLADRAHDVVRDILTSAEDGSTIVVVTHGGLIWHGVHRLVGLPDRSLGGVHNTSLTVLIDLGDARTLLGTWNSTGHLPHDL
ncbi:MAG: histidine phosphatase family protein [Nitriliruptoraceae bacterium]